MAISVHLSDDGREFRLRILGKLELADHREFRDAYLSAESNPVSYVVDLKEATVIDSATLGMFLTMREDLGGEKATIKLVNCSPKVVEILTVTNIAALFEME